MGIQSHMLLINSFLTSIDSIWIRKHYIGDKDDTWNLMTYILLIKWVKEMFNFNVKF